ncbi:MAG TPA: hypothetical protein VHU40_14035 [Polyangia bacterium]|nr:hypothetical protein [Polyangia bacterium]
MPSFTGPGEAATHAAVVRALQSKKIVVVSGSELQAAAKKQRVRLEDDAGYKAVSEALSLTAVVTGELSKKKATLTLRNGEDGSVVDEVTFVGADPRKVAAVVGRTFWKRTASGFKKTRPPGSGGGGSSALAQQAESAASEPEAPAEPEPDSKPAAVASSRKKPADEEKAEPSEEKGKSESSSKASAEKPADEESGDEGADEAAVIAVGFSDLMRSLTYNQARNDLNPDSTAKAATYSLPKAPNLIAHVDFFPLAFSSTDMLSKVGLTVDLAYLLPVVTSPGVGGSYKTSSLAWSAGLKVRLPYGLYVLGAYGDQWFKLTRSNSNMAPAPVPGTDYKFARLGVGIRKQVTSSLNLMASLGYDHCLGKPGQIATDLYFPKATCAAAEASAGIGYKVMPSVELRAGVDWRRYGLAFHVNPNDIGANRPIAGGALDQYTQIYVALAYIIGGASAEGDGAAAKKTSGEDDKKGDENEGDDKSADGE